MWSKLNERKTLHMCIFLKSFWIWFRFMGHMMQVGHSGLIYIICLSSAVASRGWVSAGTGAQRMIAPCSPPRSPHWPWGGASLLWCLCWRPRPDSACLPREPATRNVSALSFFVPSCRFDFFFTPRHPHPDSTQVCARTRPSTSPLIQLMVLSN